MGSRSSTYQLSNRERIWNCPCYLRRWFRQWWDISKLQHEQASIRFLHEGSLSNGQLGRRTSVLFVWLHRDQRFIGLCIKNWELEELQTGHSSHLANCVTLIATEIQPTRDRRRRIKIRDARPWPSSILGLVVQRRGNNDRQLRCCRVCSVCYKPVYVDDTSYPSFDCRRLDPNVALATLTLAPEPRNFLLHQRCHLHGLSMHQLFASRHGNESSIQEGRHQKFVIWDCIQSDYRWVINIGVWLNGPLLIDGGSWPRTTFLAWMNLLCNVVPLT